MPTLIGLHGRRRSGKDTAFSFIRDWAGERGVRAARRGFADDLKWSAARMFNPTMTREEAVLWCDEIKFNGTYTEEVLRDFENSRTTIATEISGRTFLQRYGTECHREIFGDDFWVDHLLPLDPEGHEKFMTGQPAWLKNFAYRYHPIGDEYIPDIAVITDLRFENEARRIRDLGGMNWFINRPEVETGDPHASEQPLPADLIDVVILNDDTLTTFKELVYDTCDSTIPDGVFNQ